VLIFSACFGGRDLFDLKWTSLKLPLVMLAVFLTPLSLNASQNGRRLAVQDEQRVVFENSIRKPSVGSLKVLKASNPRTEVEFQIAFKMRNLDSLKKRIASRRKVSASELNSNHYPQDSKYKALAQWLRRKGLKVHRTYGNRLTLEVSGTVAQAQKALGSQFSVVRVKHQNYVSALTPPSLPAKFADVVLGINGLQPYQELHTNPSFKTLKNGARRNAGKKPPYLVSEIQKAYGADGLTQTGAGQTIAILIDRFPKDSDMTAFWKANNVPQSLSNIEKVSVVKKIPKKPQGEESMDAQWTSGIAPNAKIRIYASGNLSFANIDKSLQTIINDLPSQPNLKQLSISLGACESDLSPAQLQTDQQLFAAIASQNVSIFVSSGDSGSEGMCSSGQGVEYFSSDPSVTAVGGTTLKLDASGTVAKEKAWAGSGGGVSATFARPSWQMGNGVTGDKRLVPDVALEADPNTGVYVVVNGKATQIGGTSLSAPVWAGFSALINEARAANGKTPLGLLGPRIYPLLGTSNFRDIKAGNNGAYPAKAGYDLVTGIGVPVMNQLLPTLVQQP
jgi:kumamolisin